MYLTASITRTCFASATHFFAAFVPAGRMWTVRTGCMVIGRTDATGLSVTGRTAWTLARVTGRIPAWRCTAARSEIGGKIPQSRNRRLIQLLGCRGCGRADSPRFHIRRNTFLSQGLRRSNCFAVRQSHRTLSSLSFGGMASLGTPADQSPATSWYRHVPPIPCSSMSSAIMVRPPFDRDDLFHPCLRRPAHRVGHGGVQWIQRPL